MCGTGQYFIHLNVVDNDLKLSYHFRAMWRGVKRFLKDYLVENFDKEFKDLLEKIKVKDFKIYDSPKKLKLNREEKELLIKNQVLKKNRNIFIYISEAELFIILKELNLDSIEFFIEYIKEKIKNFILQKENNFIKSIMDEYPDLIIVHSDRKIVYLNKRVYEVTKIEKPEQLIGRSIYDFVYTPYREQIEDRVKNLEKGKNKLGFAVEKVVLPDGKMMEFDASAFSLNYLNKKFLVVNYRKRNEEALLKKFGDTLSVGFVIYSIEDGKILHASKKALEILGYSEEEALGKKIEELVHFNYLETVREALERRLKGNNSVIKYEAKIVTKAGEERWIYASTTTVNYGMKKAGVAVFIDITKEREIEEEIKRLTSIFNVYLWRYKNENGGFVPILFTESVEKVTGYPIENFLEDDFRIKIIHPEDREKYESSIEAVKDGEEVNVEYRIKTKNGEILWLYDYIHPEKDSKGKVIGFSGISIDITEKKKLEEHLIKLDKISSIGTLAGGIAHDFNNLLTAIIGNLNLVNLYGVGLNPIIKKRLNEAERAAMKAKELTAKLLTFSRGGEPVKKEVNVVQLISDIVSSLQKHEGIKIEIKANQKAPLTYADEQQLKHVFKNIVENSIEAIEKSGEINITLDYREFKRDTVFDGIFIKKGEYVEIVIEDNGIGISDEYTSKAFEPYFTTKNGKTGLGLSISYSIVKRHGGFITLKSRKGKGTVVNIYLPAVESKKEKKIKKVNVEDKKVKILIMDDEEFVRAVFEDFLKEFGYDVKSTSKGEDAIKEYVIAKEKGEPFDFVILDLTIPNGLGGKETMEELLRIDPSVKAIVTSGYFDSPVMANYSEYGFKAALKKPFVIDELKEVIKKVLAS